MLIGDTYLKKYGIRYQIRRAQNVKLHLMSWYFVVPGPRNSSNQEDSESYRSSQRISGEIIENPRDSLASFSSFRMQVLIYNKHGCMIYMIVDTNVIRWDANKCWLLPERIRGNNAIIKKKTALQ